MITAYGVEWDCSINTVYKNKDKAYLAIINDLLDSVQLSPNATMVKEINQLAEDVVSLLDNDYIDDYCYITPIDLDLTDQKNFPNSP